MFWGTRGNGGYEVGNAPSAPERSGRVPGRGQWERGSCCARESSNHAVQLPRGQLILCCECVLMCYRWPCSPQALQESCKVGRPMPASRMLPCAPGARVDAPLRARRPSGCSPARQAPEWMLPCAPRESPPGVPRTRIRCKVLTNEPV